MRDLATSAFRFSWALSLFGLRQMAHFAAPSRAAEAFEDAARSLEEALRGGPEGEPGGPAADLSPERAPERTAERVPGWGPIPYRVEPPGAPKEPAPSPSTPLETASSPSAPPAAGAEPEISAEYPFEPRYAEVLGARMHYVEVGSGDPILLLHGNPTWSYVWRNIIPYLEPLGRVIAPDLIGFGRSDKPRIEYRWSDHVRYLEAFLENLGLRDVTLVLHDQGSGLGFHYARRHADNVRALAFFEAILRPYPWEQFSTPEFRELFRRFRTGGVGGEGWRLIVEQNVFIEQLLPRAAGRPLTAREMDFYREPFRDPQSRVPIWRFPRQTPIGGEPPDVWNAVSRYSEWLGETDLPKLLLYAEPGALVTAEHLAWARRSLRNLETVPLGAGSHFLQESSPHAIGRELARWIGELRRAPGTGRAQ